MKDGLYAHCNWSLIVRVEDNTITEFVKEPPPEEDLWPYVREWWVNYTIREDEEFYFTPVTEHWLRLPVLRKGVP